MKHGEKELTIIKPPEAFLQELQEQIDAAGSTKLNPAQTYEEEKEKLQNKQHYETLLLKVQVERFRQDNEGRKVLRDAIFTVTVVWMLLVLLMVWHSGSGKLKLSDSVLIALITTTTANVFGFLYVVVNYLYNRDKST
ncbi:MAG TPA: hypothetical protein VEY10_19270 [Flavisolibacter sp.]|jgi:hypothetical protein|nr:hypothetical protein [Flavisolibacter sp.]